MGKAAENEQHKLKATFYNNLAVTAVASGVLLPVFGLITKYGDWARRHRARDAIELFNLLSKEDVIEAVIFLGIFGITAWAVSPLQPFFVRNPMRRLRNFRTKRAWWRLRTIGRLRDLIIVR